MANPPILLASNNASSTLAAPITSGATTATLAAGTGTEFPNPSAGQYFLMTFTDAATGLTNEIVKVTARATDTISIVRAQEGSIASAFTTGDKARNLVTAGPVQGVFSQIIAEQTAAAQLLATPGFQSFNSGLILQWGTFSTTTGQGDAVTFPTPFPNACLGIVASEGNASGWVNTPPQPTWIGTSNVTASGFLMWVVRLVTGTPGYGVSDTTKWIAIGH